MKLFQRLKKFYLGNSSKAQYKFAINDWIRISDLDALSRVLESKRFSQNLEPLLMEHPQGKRILVLAPHPDDDVFGAGGTLIKSIRANATVKTICITTGESIREQEENRVAEALGFAIDFWDYPVRSWRVDEVIKERLRAAVRAWKPDAIFLPFLADDHKDHRRASELFYKTFLDYVPSCEIWAYQVYSTVLPNVIVDVSDVLEQKIKLVRMHQSQSQHRDWAHYLRGLNAMNSRFLKTNEPRYAEMFFVVPAEEYLQLCARYFRSVH